MRVTKVDNSEAGPTGTDSGLRWDAATVQCICEEPGSGAIHLGVQTPKGRLLVRVTPTGHIRAWIEGSPVKCVTTVIKRNPPAQSLVALKDRQPTKSKGAR